MIVRQLRPENRALWRMGPVSYRVQTNKGVWHRYVDQLLKRPSLIPELTVEDTADTFPPVSCPTSEPAHPNWTFPCSYSFKERKTETPEPELNSS